jgi:hypothetical protein
MLHRVALLRTDVSEELSASFIRVTRIDELGTTLAVTSNQHMQRACNYSMYVDGREEFIHHFGNKARLKDTRKTLLQLGG